MPNADPNGVYAIADRYVDEYAALDPCMATYLGIVGHDHEMTDYSPAGLAQRDEFARYHARRARPRAAHRRRRSPRGRSHA